MPGCVYYKGYNREQALESVGPGWATLVNTIFDKVQTYTPGIIISQVKEKYGGLRVYCESYNEEFNMFLIEVEKASFFVCEKCGATGKLRGGSWYQTLCDEHANGRTPIKPF